MSSRPPAVVAVLVATLAIGGLGATPARSAPDTSCPAPYPVAEVAAGEPVTGLTVATGTKPQPLTGTVLGVLDDGVAPDIDMIMVRLSSREIDRLGGIWEGMSGSPVYARDGRLLGAVAYGLSAGPSAVTGLTPAADLESLLDDGPPSGRSPEHVMLPQQLVRALARTGAATRQQLNRGLSALPIPYTVSGLTRGWRVSEALLPGSRGNVRVTTAAAGGRAATEVPIVTGGNVAASVSYGDVTSAGLGTATAVCGDQVLAFGHPMNHTGPATLTMHGATALGIQDDPTAVPFKLANIAAPVGVVDQDRLVGLHGVLGDAPETTDITSVVEMGAKTRTGTTRISVPDAVPEIAPLHLLADQDRIFDGPGKGSATLRWTVTGHRVDGSGFSVHRSDRYADPNDLTLLAAADLGDALAAIAATGEATFGSISTHSTLSRTYRHYSLGTVQSRVAGRWITLNANHPLTARAGGTMRIRVRLLSRDLGARWAVLRVPVPRSAAGRAGSLDVWGANTDLGGEPGGGPGVPPPSDGAPLSKVLERIRTAPHNDEVVASLNLFRDNGALLTRTARAATGAVVDGTLSIEVRGTR